jgi:hypothetical protein
MLDTVLDSRSVPEPEAALRRIPEPRRWSAATRIAFRFSFLYFGLYVLTTQMFNGMIVVPNWGFQPLEQLPPIKNLLQWTATHVFHVTQPLVIFSGSGDKTIDWIAAFCLLVISTAGTLVWSIVNRRAIAYPRTDRWFRLFLRFALATTMLGYGMVKAFPLQMPYPPLTRLLEPFGSFSPMGVLWYSVGASPGWERFAGSMELTAAVLLFIPRLSLLGAMVALADSVQIFTLNMTYDVPVKLFSFHLILMSMFLVAPDARRLLNAMMTRVPGGKILVAAQVALAAYFIGMNAYQSNQSWHAFGGGAPKPPLYGVWNVDRMYVDGVERSPLVTDYGRWRRLVIQNPTLIYFQRMDDTFLTYAAKTDMTAKSIALTKGTDKNWKAALAFDRPDNDHLALNGILDGHRIELRTTLFDRGRFLLVSRGFNWVQEFPFNR